DEARIVGLDDVRGERGLDVRAEGEGEWHRADGLEGRGELVDLEQRDHVAFNQRGVVDIDGEDGRERVERVRAARTVEAEAEAEAEVERGGDVTGGLFDVVTVLSNFADFRTVVGGGVRVAIEFGSAGRE